MGNHFDSLVDLVKGDMSRLLGVDSEHVRHWTRLLHDAALFEMPLKAQEIGPKTGKDFQQYHEYLVDFFNIWNEHNARVLMPFNPMAVEDADSVVFMRAKGGEDFQASIFVKSMLEDGTPYYNALHGDVQIGMALLGGRIPLSIDSAFFGRFSPIETFYEHVGNLLPEHRELVIRDFASNVTSCIGQIIYIQDPANWIVRREDKAYLKQSAKKQTKARRNMLRKTVMRPTYICLSQEDLSDFTSSEAKVPREAHPVRGHWRKFMSDRYVNVRGTRKFIPQYFTGNGTIDGRNGRVYQVMVKEAPDRVVDYSNSLRASR